MQNKKTTDTKNAKRIIKKYPNRRLYDTDTSAYITLSEVKRLVMEREAFVVRDAKTSEDLTRSILLQIILEEEANGSPMFSADVLANVIRTYGHAMQGFMGGYLEKSMQAVMEMQTRLGDQSAQLTPEIWSQFLNLQSPAMQGLVSKNIEQSTSMFSQLQEHMQKQTEQMLGTFGVKR